MKNSNILVCLLMILLLFLSSPAVFAKGKEKDRPPGWDKGEKKGWTSDVPPGQEKMDQTEDEETTGKKEKKKKSKKEQDKRKKRDAEKALEDKMDEQAQEKEELKNLSNPIVRVQGKVLSYQKGKMIKIRRGNKGYTFHIGEDTMIYGKINNDSLVTVGYKRDGDHLVAMTIFGVIED